jgi:hypothetical protein
MQAASRPPVFLVASELAGSPLAAALCAGHHLARLNTDELRPARPFRGRLFALLAEAAGGAPPLERPQARAAGGLPGSPGGAPPPTVGLLVPARWLGEPPVPDLLSVADHVNLRLRGALTGRWPAGAPRSFPDLSRVYERPPAVGRAPSGARVYSGLTVAGVADVGLLTPFERRAIDRLSLTAASDRLVDAVIVAAHYGLRVAAWCVPLAP